MWLRMIQRESMSGARRTFIFQAILRRSARVIRGSGKLWQSCTIRHDFATMAAPNLAKTARKERNPFPYSRQILWFGRMN